ncbi:16S rRNA (cytosine(1402)-N(4))-methyltransferase [bacterium]|nr:MAG: 16S rRNA (cytosine(1402)-N(4))-methyltransferase [bacterium]
MHIPVMLKEAIDNLDFSKNGIWIDCTLGGGGYSQSIISKLQKMPLLGRVSEARGGLGNILISFDLDQSAISNFANELEKQGFKLVDKLYFGINRSEILIYKVLNNGLEVILVNENFAKIKEVIEFLKLDNILNNLKIRGMVADLGLNSDQLDNESGFSFQNLDQELDMRLDRNSNVKALDILKMASVDELVRLFEKYADLKGSYKFCKLVKDRIKDNRDLKVGGLVEIINIAFGKNNAVKFNLHSKVFQALRIVVNSEYDNLEGLLSSGFEVLGKFGVFEVVTFHSGEDRIVKHFFKSFEEQGLIGNDLKDQPIIPNEIEVESNNRSRSAKFRFVIKK